ncbi:Predicted amidohydrolase RutB in novel pyrimidine catabolism pathway [Sphingobium indicum BiD32]|uniref:Predicted amidohydrolase RutB in novel pyrimidine catabolism pathway n=1 Tax=Sphingobium indicum BiD32 TaxID=1301087 RepID=N1MGY6_9SPHN|nr:pyrimidine utilization protein B [Sphingobium indicum]CCW16495.1 Predicted amidohydrolase RutB in novel pyrimidine catabolism pathway [Sphingobium indicum BiD32]
MRLLNPASVSQAIIDPAPLRSGPSVVLSARPEAIRLDAATTAVIIVDMQNAYASKGGYVDEAGFDVGPAASVIPKIAQVVDAARAVGMPVVFLQNGWDSGYVEAGTPLSPNWHKSNALKTMRARPELAGKFLARGGWDYDLVDSLNVQQDDLRVHKPRYSAFFNSQLDSVLRARGIRTLIFTGIATNVCVESTLRDGFHLEYFGVLLEDAVHHLGPDFICEASLYNVEKFFGWVSNVADFRTAVGQLPPKDH